MWILKPPSLSAFVANCFLRAYLEFQIFGPEKCLKENYFGPEKCLKELIVQRLIRLAHANYSSISSLSKIEFQVISDKKGRVRLGSYENSFIGL